MSLTVKIRADASQFEKTMAKVKTATANVSSGLSKAAVGVGAFAAALVGLKSAAFSSDRLFSELKASSQAASDMEMLSVQFETLTGSADKAAKMIGEFRKEATKSPLSTADYANAAKELLATGTALEEVMPILKMIGDVSMGNSERFSNLARAFSQTAQAGNLMGTELLQFINAGFSPLYQISQKTGLSIKELKKQMADGAISADMVTEAFRDATRQGGLFFRAIEKGGNTFSGQAAQLKDGIQTLRIGFGEGLNQGLVYGMKALGKNLPALLPAAQAIGKNLGVAITQAIQGDASIFMQLGVVIGEAIFAGILTIFQQAAPRIGSMLNDKFLENLPESVRKPVESLQQWNGMERALQPNPVSSDWNANNDRLSEAIAELNDLLPGGKKYAEKEEAYRKKMLELQFKMVDEMIKQGRGNERYVPPILFSR